MNSAPVRIAAISFGTTLALLVLKLVIGLISGSIAVLSDALDSGSDLIAGGAALLSVRIANLPADENHPYGHGKIESISATASAAVVAMGGGFIVFQAVRRLVEGSPDIDVGLGMAAMTVAAGANGVLAFFMRREAAQAHSLALAAESTHLQTNLVQALTVVTGLALIGVTGERVFDPLMALALAAYMGLTAIGLVKTALSDIMDMSLPEREVALVHEVLLAHQDRIRGFHRLRTRRAGPTRHVDMHLIVDPLLTVHEMHSICDSIEAEIKARLPGTSVTIHTEPDDGRHVERLERLRRERR